MFFCCYIACLRGWFGDIPDGFEFSWSVIILFTTFGFFSVESMLLRWALPATYEFFVV